MSGAGHNSGQELLDRAKELAERANPSIEDPAAVVREIIALRYVINELRDVIDEIAAGHHALLVEKMAVWVDAVEPLKPRVEYLKREVGDWQKKQQKDNPFADPKDVSRVLVDGKIRATIQETAAFDIVAPAEVPREYCSPDRNKIGAAVAGAHAIGKAAVIPGVKAYTKQTSKVL
jgi:hypothetical protein